MSLDFIPLVIVIGGNGLGIIFALERIARATERLVKLAEEADKVKR